MDGGRGCTNYKAEEAHSFQNNEEVLRERQKCEEKSIKNCYSSPDEFNWKRLSVKNNPTAG